MEARRVREEGDVTEGVVTADLISRARAGDGDAFRELTEPYRRELQVHCYRMLGSFQDAEDVLQDTLLAAWQGLTGFEGRASIRTWLYRIATRRCLNARRSASRRPVKEWDVPNVEPPEPTQLSEVVWLEPYPDTLFEGAIGVPPGPEARYEQTESISLAFVTALQLLPPRQLAVLILRDALGFHANEVADMLDSTLDSVNRALKRARTSLQSRRPSAAGRERPPASGSPSEDAIVAKFVNAYESADLDALVALLTDDVFMSMPPMPFEYEGRDVAAGFLRRHLRLGPQIRPRTDASQRPAGVRGVSARPRRHRPRGQPHRPHPHRRPDLRHDPLRERRVPMVRATAIAPEPVASFRTADLRRSENTHRRMCRLPLPGGQHRLLHLGRGAVRHPLRATPPEVLPTFESPRRHQPLGSVHLAGRRY
jgi:RNA polymerase sigma-70 factor (TIGR02960 family)